MKQQNSLQLNLLKDSVQTVDYQKIMTKQFTELYKKALSYSNCQIDTNLCFRNVVIHQNQHLHQIYSVSNKKMPHLVLLHGYGGSSLTFVRIFQQLQEHFHIHALDTFGVGLSSRGTWKDSFTPEQAGQYYLQAVEEWRKKVNIDHFYLAGHSFGGYISTLYLQKYPQRVKQLILLSPAGSGKIPKEQIQERSKNRKFLYWFAQKIYNLGFRPSRIMTTWWLGNWFIDKILKNRLKLPEQQQPIWKSYLQNVSAIKESSESGFYKLFAWPLQPYRSIEQILTNTRPKIRIYFLFGDNDWMNQGGAKRLVEENKNMHHYTVQNAGHQLIFDNPSEVAKRLIQVINI